MLISLLKQATTAPKIRAAKEVLEAPAHPCTAALLASASARRAACHFSNVQLEAVSRSDSVVRDAAPAPLTGAGKACGLRQIFAWRAPRSQVRTEGDV